MHGQSINQEFVFKPFSVYSTGDTSCVFVNCNEGLFLHWAGVGLKPLMPLATVKVIALSFTAPSSNSSFQAMVMLNINLLSKHLVVLCGESGSN